MVSTMKTKRRTESGAWAVKIENAKQLRLLAKRAAKARGMLVSAWVAEAIQEKTEREGAK